LEGEFIDLQLQNADGNDQNYYTNPSSQGCPIDQKTRFKLYKKSGEVRFQSGSSHKLFSSCFQANPDMTCLMSIALKNNDKVKIYSWDFEKV